MTRFIVGPDPHPAAITRRLGRLFRVALVLCAVFGIVFAAAFIAARLL